MTDRRLHRLGAWLDDRLGIRQAYLGLAGHLVPRDTDSWLYALGSAALLCFAVQLTTGMSLLLVYVPSAAEAWQSLDQLDHVVPLGWYVRALHYWGSNFMVALVLLHMTQVFLFGAFKFPRELTWVTGCVLLVCTLAMAFSGQILRFDQDAYWGLGIVASIAGRTPWLGPEVVHVLLGGPIIGAAALSRFFTLHVFVVPGLILACVTLHLRLVLRHGINEWPEAGRPVRREDYRARYQKLVEERGISFARGPFRRDLFVGGLVLLAIAACAALLGPKIPNGPPDPRLIDTTPRPDFFFLPLFATFALLPPYMETLLLLAAPALAIALLFAVPFLWPTGEKSPRRRPLSLVGVGILALAFAVLARLGETAPWSPRMQAWSSAPVPVAMLKGRSPLELQGASTFQVKQCRNCHALDGIGGQRGPDLSDAGARLSHDQLVRQVLQGGGNMPAYGKNLEPDEVRALVAFLETLGPRPDADDPLSSRR
jgi:ubiquinol-cytochrome c reductase cytochrome b subunit